VTTPRKPFVPSPRPSEEDLRELRDPFLYDLPGPEYPDPWLPGPPGLHFDITQVRSPLPGQAPSLDQILESEPAGTRDLEPDLEAEP
jgi:hypothetical protein